MKLEKPKEFAKKLMQDSLNPHEQNTVLHSRPVTERMQFQWDTAPDYTKADRVDEKKIWKQIGRGTIEKVSAKRIRFYQVYTWVASCLLLLGISSSIYFLSKQEEPIPFYFASTGIQSIHNIELPDGSNVQLGPKSTISYPARFTGNTREITLDGQAFFTVEDDPDKPFIVQTSYMKVEALGTSFELFAYGKEKTMEAILLEGKIKINLQNHSMKDKSQWILIPDEKIEYNIQHKKVTKTTVNANNYTSWRKGILSFENEKLSMIIPRLEQWYGRKIFFDKEMGEIYKFTFKVRDEPLDRIFYIMGKSSPIKYKQSEDGNYTLYLQL